MSTSALRVDFKDRLAVITFDQPGSRANTLGQAVLAEFETGRRPARRHAPTCEGLILRSGKPGMFIAGADLQGAGQRASRTRR